MIQTVGNGKKPWQLEKIEYQLVGHSLDHLKIRIRTKETIITLKLEKKKTKVLLNFEECFNKILLYDKLLVDYFLQ